MLRRYFFLSILMITVLLAGCAPMAVAQAAEVRALENPASTELTEKATSIPVMKEEVVPRDPPPSCPVTTPQDPPFIPPSPYSPDAAWENYFWFGSTSLWIMLPTDGIWAVSPNKVFWWREGYIWNEELEPQITVTGERLDAPATPFKESGGTNAYASDIGSAMLTGIAFPTPGCWKITGQYGDAELSFVVWVAP